MQFIEPVYRPPMEANSMLLPVMQSCTWNKCNFCYRSKDYQLLVADKDDVEQEVIRQKPYYPDNASIFLVGSNAFAIPASKLKEYVDAIRRHLPHFSDLSMFSRVDAIRHKTDEELNELRKSGVTHLYVGVENGNDDALQLMNKGHTAKEAVEQLKRLDKAGIAYTLFYIFGMGGKGTGQQTGRDTAALFNKVRPRRIVTTGMTVTEGTGAADMQAKGQFVQANEREKIEELRTFLENLEVDTFYDGIHYLNPLHFRFQNSNREAKAKVMAEIDRVLNTYSDEELERAINRKAMEEASKPQRVG